ASSFGSSNEEETENALLSTRAKASSTARRSRSVFASSTMAAFSIITPSSFKPPHDDAAVLPAEAEGVGHGRIHLQFARGVGHVVEVALGVGLVQVDGR